MASDNPGVACCGLIVWFSVAAAAVVFLLKQAPRPDAKDEPVADQAPSKSLSEELERHRGGCGGLVFYGILTGILPVLAALVIARLWAEGYVLWTGRKDQRYRVWVSAFFWFWRILLGWMLVSVLLYFILYEVIGFDA